MTTFTVTNTNDSGAGSLRQAILDSNTASGADTIVFDNSLNGSTINVTSGEITITDNLTVEGLGANNLTIDAGGGSRIFAIEKEGGGFLDINVNIEDLTITGGYSASDGGAISALSSTFSDVNLTISDSVFSDNNTDSNGGAIFANGDSQITVFNSIFTDNDADLDGGAIFTDFLADVTASDSVFSNNSAGGNGGAISNGSVSSISVFSTTIETNTAGNDGGGIFSPIGSVVLGEGTIVNSNTAGRSGGGIHTNGFQSIDSTITNNQAVEDGGGARVEAAGVIINSNISNNEADNGGGLYIINFGVVSAVVIANTTISSNRANDYAGGIYAFGALFPQPFNPMNPTNIVSSEILATNVTITDNIADSNNDGTGDGGGIYTFPTDTSFARIQGPAKINFENSIIAGNFDTPNNNGAGLITPDISGAARGNANNLLGDDRGLTIESSVASATESLGSGRDLVNIDAGLGILQDNSGFTQTIELLPGSPAIDKGDNSKVIRETFIDVTGNGQPTVVDFDRDPATTNAQLPYDQRGDLFERIVNGTVDIGAFEVQAGIPNDLSLTGTTAEDTLTGSGGNDTLRGLAGNDILNGENGDDDIFGGNGRDTINGGAGDDNLQGQNNFDLINGDEGNDTISGGNGRDTINGGDGNDVITGGNSNDILNGNKNNDLIKGNSGRDTLNGNGGADTLVGGNDNDILNGAWGSDSLRGGNGSDILIGGRGNDSLIGGRGSDSLIGGGARDTLTGGGAADDFVFNAPSQGFDNITDFSTGVDDIVISNSGFGGNVTTSDFTYNSGNGQLRFTGTLIAVLDGAPSFNIATDIAIV